MRALYKRIQKGFTLIEVLIIVAILALLIVLAFSTVLKNLLKGNDARKKADLDKIKIYIEEYEKDHNCYPTAESMTLCGSDESIAINPYLSNVPCDPLTHEAYTYEPDPDSPACPSWFKLYADLQNENDPKIIAKIGPNAAYNYYVSSPNAPKSVSNSPDEETQMYGCINYQCVPVSNDPEDVNYCTSTTFDTSNCNGNDCSLPSLQCN